MGDNILVGADSLKSKRQTLRTQRQLKVWQGVWRFLALLGMVGGLIWIISWPHWVIKDQSQIKIVGNRLLSSNKIRQLLNVSYPQSIWQLPLHQLTQQLKKEPPFKDVHLTRQLFPTQITVTVKERQPVVMGTSSQGDGYLDATGVWISKKFYGEDVKVETEQDIIVHGFNPRYRSHWLEIYHLILQSPIKITTVDWQDPSNLILKTELGTIHCGPYGDRFQEQLQVLARMSKLSSSVPPDRIFYLDVTNPQFPSINLNP
ncbi:cell division protein FtsQ/DivIB [Cyanobacterium sp. uoEpiScrs1]|uniref:cell division protein FtsQ/DivIB n=1 Tax=Cyanobacterium sp. uoEpiScrs1 TaxID=2976343 RepID=UPI00226A2DB1|nr:FtsQ-type POTRA domain-containing protein [Cyanobacterium sp. uoEpiScrs1]